MRAVRLGVPVVRIAADAGQQPRQRTLSKNVTFGTIYGGGAAGLARQAGIPVAQAADTVDRFRRAYPAIRRYGFALAERDAIVTRSTRRLPADPDRRYATVNYMIQSTARDLLVEALHRLVTQTPYGAGLVLPIHDEILIQAPADQAEQALAALITSMTTTFMGVPIEADGKIHGPRWTGDDT